MLEIKFNEKGFSSFMEGLVGRRFKSLKEIDGFIFNGTDIKVGLSYDEHFNEVERLEGYDYCLKSNVTINEMDFCYLDVYFIRDNSGKFYITEVGTDFNT